MAAELSSGKQIVGRLVLRVVVGLVLAAVLVFSADYAVLRFRVATNGDAYGTVTVRPYYAIPQKSKKTELDFEPPQDETCVNSLFPHMGFTPCWYRRGHTQEQLPDH
ncbi:MAG TPA: hypothetical protein VGL53_19135 [Bryobacteraceae bacterium]